MPVHPFEGPEVEPLVVRVRDACRLLSCSQTRIYELMASGEIEAFRDGGSRRVLMSSVKQYIDRRRREGGHKLRLRKRAPDKEVA